MNPFRRARSFEPDEMDYLFLAHAEGRITTAEMTEALEHEVQVRRRAWIESVHRMRISGLALGLALTGWLLWVALWIIDVRAVMIAIFATVLSYISIAITVFGRSRCPCSFCRLQRVARRNQCTCSFCRP